MDEERCERFFKAIESKRVCTSDIKEFCCNTCILNFLNLSQSRITDDGLRFLGSLQGIKHLRLNQCPLVSDVGIHYLDGLTSLVSLNLSKCKRITDLTMETIGKLKNLKVVQLADLRITNQGIEYLKGLQLEEIDLSRTLVTSSIISSLAESNTRRSLIEITLVDTEVNDITILFKIADFPALCKINLGGTKVSKDGSLLKLTERINQTAKSEIAKLTRGAVLEITRAEVSSGKSKCHPSQQDKDVWHRVVSSHFAPFLNQTVQWPLVIDDTLPEDLTNDDISSPFVIRSTPVMKGDDFLMSPPPKRNASGRKTSFGTVPFSPVSPTPQQRIRRPSNRKGSTPSLFASGWDNKENSPMACGGHSPIFRSRNFDSQFPKPDVLQSLSNINGFAMMSPSKRKFDLEFSPISPSQKRVRITNEGDSPLPKELTELLQLEYASPVIPKKKQIYNTNKRNEKFE